MLVNTSNAVKFFFSNTSLQLVYFEAIANSIDAGADSIDISIQIDSFSNTDSLVINITDNGEGFTDKNFTKFSKLLEAEGEDHKGLGRLVYLNYFKSVEIESTYNGHRRAFIFDDKFDGKSSKTTSESQNNKTSLTFSGYTKKKIKSYEYLQPKSLKKEVLSHFFPLFHTLKRSGKKLNICFQLQVNKQDIKHEFTNQTANINIEEIQELECDKFTIPELDMYQEFQLYYSVNKKYEGLAPITSLSVDGRAQPMEILSKDSIPVGYEVIFLLYSDFFTGKTNASRQEFNFRDNELNIIKKIFRKKISLILKDKIPDIQERNVKTNGYLEDHYPHLVGLFEEDSVGIIDKNESLKVAQKKFFQEQKSILEATDLNDAIYEKSLDFSSRILTEYVLYRNITLNRLKKMNPKNSEAEIHDIIAPMRTTFKKDNFVNDIYKNNAWLLDDKYMSYTTILSDEDMDKLVREISLEEDVEKDESRPDIALVFSKNPSLSDAKVDVVIVELKKMGLKLQKREEVISQLRQRARKLLNYYPNRIQRIWFYGIVDFNKEFIRSLKEEEYLEVYSNGHHYYKEIQIMPDYDEDKKVPIGVNLLSFDAFIKDAESRNSTFLTLLKEGLKEKADKYSN